RQACGNVGPFHLCLLVVPRTYLAVAAHGRQGSRTTRQPPRHRLSLSQAWKDRRMRVPPRPPLTGLKRSLDQSRSQAQRDGFVRQTFSLPRTEARAKAQEWFDRWPKQG